MRTYLHHGLPLLLAVIFAGCSIFQKEPAVSIDPDSPDLSARWNAELSTPRSLSGAMEISGTAWMALVEGEDAAEVFVRIENAAPGGVHPWQVNRGRCGADQGFVGSEDDYRNLEVGDEGRASATARLAAFAPREDRSYFIAVYGSQTNRGLTIACGNLSRPAN